MRSIFVAAWLVGSVALVAGARPLLIPCGLVLTAAGATASRRLRVRPGRFDELVARLSGHDVRSTARLAALLVTVLGIAWVAAGVRAAV